MVVVFEFQIIKDSLIKKETYTFLTTIGFLQQDALMINTYINV